MNENSKLTFESNGLKHVAEIPWDANVDDFFDATMAIGVAATYSYKALVTTFYERSKELLEIYFPDELNNE